MGPQTALTLVSTGASLLSGVFGAAGQRAEARATAKALKEEKAFNLGVLNQQKIDTFWSDQMNQWKSGLSLSAGTSAMAVVESNQNVLQNKINYTGLEYDKQIRAANAAAKRRFMGVF